MFYKALLFFLLLSSQIFGQENSIIEILDNNNNFIGRGTVVSRNPENGLGTGLTADHVVRDLGPTFKVKYRNGFVVRECSVIESFQDRDLAAIRILVPEGIEVIKLTEDVVDEGYVFDRQWKKQEVRLLLTQNNNTYYQFTPQPGESGGPIFSKNMELIGVVSGGWMWLDKKEDDERRFTWPLRSPRLFGLRKYNQ